MKENLSQERIVRDIGGPPTRPFFNRVPALAAGFGIIVTAFVLWSTWNIFSVTPSSNYAQGTILSDNEVRVQWTGSGEELLVDWDPMQYDDLKNYSVDIYGLYPEKTWANSGYRRPGLPGICRIDR